MAAKTPVESPLKQVNTDENALYKPKIFSLYDSLFSSETHPPGYWVEFFLLPVNTEAFQECLSQNSPLIAHQQIIRMLVSASIANISAVSQDTSVAINSLAVLQTVFKQVLLEAKSAPAPNSPSTYAITALCGIETADKQLDALSAATLQLLQNSDIPLIVYGVDFVFELAKQSSGTSLVTILTAKNFFSALIRVISTYLTHPIATKAFTALGLITMLNSYDDDAESIYTQRICDFVDEDAMTKMVALLQRELALPLPAPSYLPKWFRNESKEIIDTNNYQILITVFFFCQQNDTFTSILAESPLLNTLIEILSFCYAQSLKSSQYLPQCWLLTLILRKVVETQFSALVSPSNTDTKIYDHRLNLETKRRSALVALLVSIQHAFRGLAKRSLTPQQVPLIEQLLILTHQVCVQISLSQTETNYEWTPLWLVLFGLLRQFARHPQPALKVHVKLVLTVLAGMTSQKQALDELDWNTLVFHIVQTPDLFTQLSETYPEVARSAEMVAINAMIKQYKTYDTDPNLTEIAMKGRVNPPLTSELKLQFNDSSLEFRKQVHSLAKA